jgi:hypothetical protein
MDPDEVVDITTRAGLNRALNEEPVPARGERHEEYVNPTQEPNDMELWRQRNIEENYRAQENMRVGDDVVEHVRDELYRVMGVPADMVTGLINRNGDIFPELRAHETVGIVNMNGGTEVAVEPTLGEGVTIANTAALRTQTNTLIDTAMYDAVLHYNPDITDTRAPLSPQKYHCPSCNKTVTSKFCFVWKEDDEAEENRYEFCSRCLAHAIHQLVPKLRPLPREELPVVEGTIRTAYNANGIGMMGR